MTAQDLATTLADLPRVGRLIKDRAYRQVWRFEHAGRAYYLKFYPRAGSFLKRCVRGNPAIREFRRLQWLQKAHVPAPRAVAAMVGFRIGAQLGDAVILEAIEPSVTLAEHVDAHLLDGRPLANHRDLAGQIVNIISKLQDARLGHGDLHLGNFLLSEGRLYLLDAYAVRRGGMRRRDLLLLEHSSRRIATRSDRIRAWRHVGRGVMPLTNPLRRRLARKFVSKATTTDGQYFGRLVSGQWAGYFTRRAPAPRRWSRLSRLATAAVDWEALWSQLLGQIERDELQVIKRTRSGDVLAGAVTLGGEVLEIIIKRPRRKYWWRYINEIGRGPRAMRAWKKAWSLVIRDIPTALPLAVMEKRRLGYVIDAVILFERLPGAMLADVDLDALTPEHRDTLLRRAGRLLRAMEQDGLYHWDAKAWNFIVRPDERLGPQPMLIDVDGIRTFQYTRFAIHRLLRSMHDNCTYRPADSRSLCLGYAPHARLVRTDREEAAPPTRAVDGSAGQPSDTPPHP